MVALIDYGIGNLRSMEKALLMVGADVVRTDRVDDIERADRVVLPGVGAFGACAAEIRRRGLEPALLNFIHSDRPFLGVCVGMQLLFEWSEELGEHSGFGVLPGRVVRFAGAPFEQSTERCDTVGPADPGRAAPDRPLKVPHMGWNAVSACRPSPLLENLERDAYFYFVHSYHARPSEQADVLALTRYGVPYSSIVNRNNVFGVQFHPEKSQKNGLQVLLNFCRL